MPRRQQLFEEAGGQRLPLARRRQPLRRRARQAKQGKKNNKYQGTTPKKKHRTKLFDTPMEAAIALAQLLEELFARGAILREEAESLRFLRY